MWYAICDLLYDGNYVGAITELLDAVGDPSAKGSFGAFLKNSIKFATGYF